MKRKIGGLGHHYGGGGAIQLIEQKMHKNMQFLAQRETFWQHKLRVYVENDGKSH